MQKKTVTGYVLMVCAVLLIGIVIFENSGKSQIPIVFSEKSMLESLWKEYKVEYLEPVSGRTLDKQQDNITTSEGESYSMLRAVWMDDRATYDQSLKWTNDNLKRPDDHLFAWLFGKGAGGKYQVLKDKGGDNTASDADSDIALSLVFAYNRWHEDQYLSQAKEIIADIWNKEVVTIKGKPYLAANNLEKSSPTRAIINPSYLSPYAYRIFAKIDPAHPWNKLVDTSYDVINFAITDKLDKSQSANLPPDWVSINKTTGVISAVDSSNLTTNFSYDALRLPWRLAIDNEWFHESRAKAALDKLSLLQREWQSDHKIAVTHSHDGSIVSDNDAPAMYGGTIGYFMVSDPSDAKAVYENKLSALFSSDTLQWKESLSYYDDNWAWFGLGLYNHLLPNLAP
jgi:endo-1,4-beta-D-glucanase Y